MTTLHPPPGPNPGGAVVRVDSSGPDLDEVLWVDPDGSVWLEVRRGDGARADHVGFFRSTRRGPPVRTLVDAASAIAAAPLAPEWTQLGRRIRVEVSGIEMHDQEAVATSAGGWDELLASVARLSSEAVASPVAAAQVEARLVVVNRDRVVGVAVHQLGPNPLAMSVDVASSTLLWTTGASVRAWEPWPAPLLGLTRGDGTFLDGILAPALLSPGVVALLSLPIGARGSAAVGPDESVRVDLVGRFAWPPFEPPSASPFRARSGSSEPAEPGDHAA